MLRRGFWLFAAAILVAARAAPPFPQEGSDLAPDPAARYGSLPNGVRYALVPAAGASGRVSLRLLVASGARQEAEDQRGVAHLVEHLAFDGSAHYAAGDLVEYLQRMGMSFGADANANTSFDRTVYLLELPENRPAIVADALQVLRDYAGGLRLDPGMIEKERGVVLSERRARDSLPARVRQARREFCLGDDLVPWRRPIGVAEVVRHVGRERLVDYYDTWYRPERMTIVAAGDFDPLAMTAAIAAAFSDLRARAAERADPDPGAFRPAAGLQVHYFPQPEEPGPQVTLSTVTPCDPGPDTAERRRQILARDLALAIVNERLTVLALRSGSPFASGLMTVREHVGLYRLAEIELGCKRLEWPEGVAAAEQTLRQALEFGFQPEELREAVANRRRGLLDSVRNASHRTAKEIADAMILTLRERRVFLSPEAEGSLLGPVLDRITPEDCATALRAAWAAPHRFLMVGGGAQIDGDAVGQITAMYDRAHAQALQPPARLQPKTWSYRPAGPPGRVIRQASLADLDVTQAVFANGVRLTIKPTRFEVGRIEVGVRFGTGEMGEPPGKTGLGYFASQTFVAGGLRRYSVDDLRRLFAGRKVGADFTVADDAFTLHGSSTPEDLELEMELLAAEFTEPGYRPETEDLAQTLLISQYHTLIHTLEGPLAAVVPRLLANGDVRIGLPPANAVLTRTLKEVDAWLSPQMEDGPVEITIVGDCDPAAATAAVARTFGALGPRRPKAPADRLTRIAFPAEAFSRAYAIPTAIPTALVAIYWPTTDSRGLHVADGLQLLARVLGDRLRVKIREQLGDTYTPVAGSMTSEAYPGYGYLRAEVTVDPAKADAIAAVVKAIALDLARHGVSPDELARAKEPALARAREFATTNRFWLNALSRSQEKPETLERPRRQIADLVSITPADLNALAQAYLREARAFSVIIRPALAASEPKS